MAGKNQALWCVLAQECRRLRKAITILLRFARVRRAGSSALAKVKIAAQNVKAMLGQLFRHLNKQGGVAIGPGAMRQHNTGFVRRPGGQVKHSLNSVVINFS
jgi:hypothetical protein